LKINIQLILLYYKWVPTEFILFFMHITIENLNILWYLYMYLLNDKHKRFKQKMYFQQILFNFVILLTVYYVCILPNIGKNLYECLKGLFVKCESIYILLTRFKYIYRWSYIVLLLIKHLFFNVEWVSTYYKHVY